MTCWLGRTGKRTCLDQVRVEEVNSKTLMIDGNWSSPGGDAKVFKSTNAEYSINYP